MQIRNIRQSKSCSPMSASSDVYQMVDFWCIVTTENQVLTWVYLHQIYLRKAVITLCYYYY